MDKRCITCGTIKPIDEFHFAKNRKDGRNPECKQCRQKYGRTFWQKNKEIIAKRAKRFYEENKEKILERNREYRQTDKAKIDKAKKVREYNLGNPQKYKAHNAVNNCIRDGKLPRTKTLICSICNEKQAEHYHHPNGYEPEHWLDVIPVCNICHNNLHNSYKYGV
jgi:hypothetical protein